MPEITIIDESMERALKKFPKLRRQTVGNIAIRMKQQLDTEISTRLNDDHGKIRGWQRIRTGSKGGYGVIEATNETSGDNSPGAITNYLEHGHRIRPPKRTPQKTGGKGYRPRIRTSYVDGHWFYKSVENKRDFLVSSEIKKMTEELAATLEGRR